LERAAYHESGDAIACLSFGIEIIRVTIDAATPHLFRGRYRERAELAIECMGTMALSGPAAETFYVAPSLMVAIEPTLRWREATWRGDCTRPRSEWRWRGCAPPPMRWCKHRGTGSD
jgi:hypothetical protein